MFRVGDLLCTHSIMGYLIWDNHGDGNFGFYKKKKVGFLLFQENFDALCRLSFNLIGTGIIVNVRKREFECTEAHYLLICWLKKNYE